jgi:hypothetical protein
MFPVGFLSKLFIATPILDKNGKYKSFYAGWAGNRNYPVDMASFATNVKHLIEVLLKQD